MAKIVVFPLILFLLHHLQMCFFLDPLNKEYHSLLCCSLKSSSILFILQTSPDILPDILHSPDISTASASVHFQECILVESITMSFLCRKSRLLTSLSAYVGPPPQHLPIYFPLSNQNNVIKSLIKSFHSPA